MNIFPAVKKIEYDPKKSHLWKNEYTINAQSFPMDWFNCFTFLSSVDHASSDSDILCVVDQDLGEEAYHIILDEKNIHMTYATEKGLFYALITLKQLMQQQPYRLSIPCFALEDEPDLPIRGLMLDISRNKIPQKDTIKQWIDRMASLKYNHLELYVEGMSFLYPSFKDVYDKEQTPLTQDDFLEIQEYAKSHMIDLVPCHNGLGHMTEWLTKFPHLAELPEGMFMWGAYRKASTLNPLSQESYHFVKTLYQDAIKGSISPFFHMNLDEPYELGHGKSKEKADIVGVGQVYLEYLLKLYELISSWGKTPLVWGDVLNHHPETLEKLPKDLIFVDWGYDYDYPFSKTLQRLALKQVKFMAAPGTSSWNSISGRTDDMIENIAEACHWTKVYKGLGILLTDWGDNGHWQQDIISYPALIFTGLESWRSHPQNRHMIKKIINLWFEDQTESLGKLLLDLGTYDRYQPNYQYNRTALMDVMILNRLVDYQHMSASLASIFEKHMFCNPKIYQQLKLWIDEIKHRRSLISLHPKYHKFEASLDLTILMLDVMFDFIFYFHPALSHKEKTTLRMELKKNVPILLESYQQVWLASNQRGGLKDSMQSLKLIHDFMIAEA